MIFCVLYWFECYQLLDCFILGVVSDDMFVGQLVKWVCEFIGCIEKIDDVVFDWLVGWLFYLYGDVIDSQFYDLLVELIGLVCWLLYYLEMLLVLFVLIVENFVNVWLLECVCVVVEKLFGYDLVFVFEFNVWL